MGETFTSVFLGFQRLRKKVAVADRLSGVSLPEGNTSLHRYRFALTEDLESFANAALTT